MVVVENADDYRLAVDLKVGKSCWLTVDDLTDIVKVTWDSSDTSVATISRKYKSLAEGIKGYYDFNYSRYANLKGVTNYNTSCKLIRLDGWATDISYTTKLVTLIEDNELWKDDLRSRC